MELLELTIFGSGAHRLSLKSVRMKMDEFFAGKKLWMLKVVSHKI
jgi:hypothetical protein